MPNTGPCEGDANSRCSCKGYNLDRLLQPSILTYLARQDLHGYLIIQELENQDLQNGEKPDNAGVYRSLKKLEENGMVSSFWDTAGEGAPRKIFSITEAGRECLANWTVTLEKYREAIQVIVDDAKDALGVKDKTI